MNNKMENKSSARTLKYEGRIEHLPVRVVQEMIDEQVRQGNQPDYGVFEKDFWADKSQGGFNWDESENGHDYWESIESYSDIQADFSDDELVDSLARIRILTDKYLSLSNKSKGTLDVKGYGKLEAYHTEEEKEMAIKELVEVKKQLLKLLK